MQFLDVLPQDTRAAFAATFRTSGLRYCAYNTLETLQPRLAPPGNHVPSFSFTQFVAV